MIQQLSFDRDEFPFPSFWYFSLLFIEITEECMVPERQSKVTHTIFLWPELTPRIILIRIGEFSPSISLRIYFLVNLSIMCSNVITPVTIIDAGIHLTLLVAYFTFFTSLQTISMCAISFKCPVWNIFLKSIKFIIKSTQRGVF